MPPPLARVLCGRLGADRLLIAVSVGWGAIVVLSGTVASSPDAFVVTAGVIGVNFLLSTWKLVCRARVYVVLNLVQFALFGILSHQLYSAGGAEHYRCSREPGFVDWAEFTAAHVLRAADVLDAVDQYGINLQHVHHASPAAGSLLVLMHLAVDVFLISLAARWLARARRTPIVNHLREGRKVAGWLILALVLYVGCAFTPEWQRADWFLWPLDNTLRLVDVGDAFQVFHWQLHHVGPGPFTDTAAVVFRLAVGMVIGRLIFAVRMGWLSGMGLTVDELIEELQEGDRVVRRGAAQGLAKSGPDEPDVVGALARALAADRDRGVRLAAARSLARLGGDARAAVPALIVALEEIQPDVRNAAIDALALIGFAAVPALEAATQSRCSWVRQGAAEALRLMALPVERQTPDRGW